MTRIHIPIGAVEYLLGDGAEHGLHTLRYAMHLAEFYNKHRPRFHEKLDLEKVFMFGAFHCTPYPGRFDPTAYNPDTCGPEKLEELETLKTVFHGGFSEWRNWSQQYPSQKTLTMRLVREAHTLALLDHGISPDDAAEAIFTDRGKSIYERKHVKKYTLRLVNS